MRNRTDFLKECMSDVGPMPLDQFNRTFCAQCANRDCSRNGAQNLAFDHRVNNWKTILFDAVPRAQDTDVQYDPIRLKRFLPLDPNGPRPPNVGFTPISTATATQPSALAPTEVAAQEESPLEPAPPLPEPEKFIPV